MASLQSGGTAYRYTYKTGNISKQTGVGVEGGSKKGLQGSNLLLGVK